MNEVKDEKADITRNILEIESSEISTNNYMPTNKKI